MDFSFSEEQKMLRDSVRKLMDKHAPAAMVAEHDQAGTYPYDLHKAWAEAGLMALPFSPDHGGLGGSVIDLAIIAEEIAYTSADFFMAYAGGIFCGLNIERKGSEAQKQKYLPQLISGDLRMAISISEADAGSDITAMKTGAIKTKNGWRISGDKLWCTGAGVKNTLLNVYLITDPDVNPRKGMSLFLIPNDTPGVEIKKLDMLGRKSTGTYEIHFDNVEVPDDAIIGGENAGWDCVLSGLQVERIASSAGNIGASLAVVDLASNYAKERSQFGRTIGSNQAIAHMLADMKTRVAAARALMWQAACKVSSGEDALMEISMAKLYSSETYVEVANSGMQIFGAFGYSMEYPMQRHYRDARSATIAAGSSQMQRNLIAGLMGHKV